MPSPFQLAVCPVYVLVPAVQLATVPSGSAVASQPTLTVWARVFLIRNV